MPRPYNVSEAQAHTVVIDEDCILNRVAIDRLTPVQKSAKDAIQAQSKYKGSPTQNNPTFHHTVKHTKKRHKDQQV